MVDTFDWLKPSPLWQDDGADVREQDFAYFRPRILEFRSDDFVGDFLTIATSPQPKDLDGHAVVPPDGDSPRKLYLPNHGCFYLICASLCCREPHAPDRQVKPAFQESVFMVLRKRIGTAEYGWIPTGPSKGWQPLDAGGRALLPTEQRLPLSATTTCGGRSIWFGYLPVTSSESYGASPALLAAMARPGETFEDTREFELKARFSQMLGSLPSAAQLMSANPPGDIRAKMSVFLMLDLWEFLAQPDVLPDVATMLRDHPDSTFPGDTAKAALMAFLQEQPVAPGLSLATAISNVARKQQELELPEADPAAVGFDARYELIADSIDTATLERRVKDALPADTRPALELPKLESRSNAQYVVRCIYERPQCTDEIAVVSLATDPFVIARFFDPDAPVRPVKIPMPTDVSIAGLRKFKKGVSFVISKSLNNKMSQIGQGALKDPIELEPEGSDQLAYICSFSIQIIFIVALFLLLIFAIVLNFVFWWIALLKICLPIPKSLVDES